MWVTRRRAVVEKYYLGGLVEAVNATVYYGSSAIKVVETTYSHSPAAQPAATSVERSRLVTCLEAS
jgi:hypothetical protein